jgi:hypothetical protein
VIQSKKMREVCDHGDVPFVAAVGDSPLTVGGWMGVDCLSALVLRTELRAWGDEGRDGIGVTRAGVPGTVRERVSTTTERGNEMGRTRSVVDHVRLDETSSRQRRHQTQLPGHDGGTDDPRESLSVLSGVRRVGTADTKDVEHGALGQQDCQQTSQYGVVDESERDVLVPPPTVPTSIEGMLHVMRRSSPSLIASMRVIQFDDSTFCAGSCPVAK